MRTKLKSLWPKTAPILRATAFAALGLAAAGGLYLRLTGNPDGMDLALVAASGTGFWLSASGLMAAKQYADTMERLRHTTAHIPDPPLWKLGLGAFLVTLPMLLSDTDPGFVGTPAPFPIIQGAPSSQ